MVFCLEVKYQIVIHKNMGIFEKLEGFEPKKAKESLDMLLIDRNNEFKELARGMGIPTTSTNW